ncbi:hypothetical protein N9K65_05960 [Candidatus Poseidoniales archaeon]|nr:hypothetical protein [Candidatus Poseidoniales archaeon]MDB2320336.1 hypothetical protein [Candidatus Poseidoniales archaeon]
MYLHGYTDKGCLIEHEINWDEKGKLVLSKRQEVKWPVKVLQPGPRDGVYVKGKLMSYVLGKSPFYLIGGNSICFENVPLVKKLEQPGEILSARATKDGLILIHRRYGEHFLMKFTHDGREEENTKLSDLPSNFRTYVRWHSFNQPSLMHSLDDFSTQNLPIGYSEDKDGQYTFYYFERESIHKSVLNCDDGRLMSKQEAFFLDVFSADKQITILRNLSTGKFSVKPAYNYTSFWISQTSLNHPETKIHTQSRD